MIRKNVAEILRDHVTFELEAIDRMYLNAYVPSLQTGGGLVYFLKTQLGVRVPSTVMVAPMSQRFVDAIERFVAAAGLDLVTFKKGQRKDDVAHQYLAKFKGQEGVLFVGKAQEKASVFRTEKRRDARGGPVDHSLDRDGQSRLRLPRRQRLWPAVHQVLFLLPLPCQALSQWARVAEAPVDAPRDSIRAVGQRHPLECRGRPRGRPDAPEEGIATARGSFRRMTRTAWT